ncbi:MAG: hypothetical protein HRU80_10575 [Ignavibacteriales bacterium]|nr:hypothetical protein [Ignavibacteriaceae bacterium]QOJ29301.1 MAG: hypothetical protein HRU80_10575 [Ignavibacteriales bacterium]
MDFIKDYLIQVLTDCSNKLRLDSSKLEVITLLKEQIYKSESPEVLFRNMKKVTEFAKLAIRLNDIYVYLNTTKIEFRTISKKFEEHSDLLLKDLTPFLDILTGVRFQKAMEKVLFFSGSAVMNPGQVSAIIDFSAPKGSRVTTESLHQNTEEPEPENQDTEIPDDPDHDSDMTYQQYESRILHPIRGLDEILKALLSGEYNADDLTHYSKLILWNSQIAMKFGTEIVAKMHLIIAKALPMIRDGELKPTKDTIESIRACLIVIVALVRGKGVDIKMYIDRAEEFGKKILRK